MSKDKIESRVRQGPEIAIIFPEMDGLLPFEVGLFHRTDYHEDGSKTEWYGIELSKEQYKSVRAAIK